MQRTLAAVVVGTVLAGACWQNASHYFSLPTLHASQVLPDSFWTRGNVRKDLAFMAARSARPAKFLARIPRPYPYSVVPGGVKDPDDLRYAALRDYVVRRHYARFNYSHARLVRATEAREVYLSYRIRDSIFWTRRRIRLHLGELLLTDGKITARARCGNQISDTAKPDVSDEEPDQDILDRPVAEIEPMPSFPMRPVLAPPELPGGGPMAPRLFAGVFVFPYVPVGAVFGLSYVCLFEAYAHGRVSVVSPVVATESLWAVGLSALLLRQHELVGRRLALGAVTVVAGSVLIGAFR